MSPRKETHPYFNLSHLTDSQLGSTHGAYPSQNIGEKPPETKALNITFPSKEGRTVSVAAWNGPLYSISGETPTLNFSGPIVGICEFGLGGMAQRFEFNLPPPFIYNTLNGDNQSRRDFSTNGVQFNLTCAAMTLAFRNDCNTLAVLDQITNNLVPIAVAVYQTQPTPPGVFNAPPTMSSTPQPAIVGASLAINPINKQLAPLERVYPLVNRLGTQMAVSPAANSSLIVGVPQFAKRVRIYHSTAAGTASQISVRLHSFLNRFNIEEPVILGTGQFGPIEIPAYCSELEIVNTGANVIGRMYASFELSI